MDCSTPGFPAHHQLPELAQIHVHQVGDAIQPSASNHPTILAATAAKSLQSCSTLCDPIDGSPPGSPIPGTLQARILEWVGISFSKAWKWKVKVKSLLCPTLSDLMDCSLPGYSVQLSSPLSFSFSSCFQSFPASGSFLMSQFFASGGQSTGASASVLPMNIQGWFPLGLTGLISLQSKGLSRVFSNNTVQKHQFFGTQFSLWSNSHIHHDHWKNHSFDQMDLCRQSNVSAF